MICPNAMKRAFDVVVSAVALVAALPVLLVVTAAVWLTLGRPILFRQKRPGLHGKPFVILKFRTMRLAGPGERETETDGLRLTRLGRFLRRTSLDELPELWNVLRGDMSLVGPRPLLMEYLDRYTPEQMRRHEVKPGITGWAQVNGRNAIDWAERFALDTWYIEHATLWLDLRILLMTIGTAFRQHGIAAASHATMPEFTGTTPVGRETP